jgi:hypothetical protein
MIKSATHYPVSQLFDIESKVIYAIPRYQREYSWGKYEWEELFDDILENDEGYFLGSIICINQSTDSLSDQRLELIDGQQRLATLSLLFAAIFRILINHKVFLNEDQQSDVMNLKRKLVLKGPEEKTRLILQIQNHNYDDYCAVLKEIGILHNVQCPLYAGNRKIFRAYRYFQDRLERLMQNGQNSIVTVIDFLKKVNQTGLVKIEVASHADAYTLFESLNNRGVPLTAIDLIKNKLLAKLDEHNPGTIDAYYAQWNQIIENLGEDYTVQERFFRQYYNAFKPKLKDIVNVPIAIISNLIMVYEKLINHDARGFLEKSLAASENYAVLLNLKQTSECRELQKSLKDLERIQGAPSYILLLYLLEYRDRLGLSMSHIASIVRSLVCFFVRRNLTDIPPTRDLTKLFMNIIEVIKEKQGAAIVALINTQLAKVSAPDEEFQRKLEGPIYTDNTDVTRFILCVLAEQGMTKETEIDLWRMENKNYLWTIEHIFPKGDKIPDSWVQMIANGDERKAKELQEDYVHTLGNLTISCYNSALGTKSFREKRDRVDSQGRPIGYNNRLSLNADLANATSWSIEQIQARTKKLASQVMDMFALNRGEDEST